jgi:hypothetical protein
VIELGNPLPDLGVTIRNTAGLVADAGAVALTITLPDLTTTTPVVVHASTGVYTSAYTPTTVGRYTVRWVATGANASAWTTIHDVVDPSQYLIISMSEAMEHLRLPATARDTYAARLQPFLLSLTPMIENIIGPVVSRTITETHNGGSNVIKVLRPPIISVTTVIEVAGAGFSRTLTLQDPTTAGALDAYGYSVDLERGILFRRVSGLNGSFLPGVRNVSVTYVAGRNPIPPNVIHAAKDLLRINWEVMTAGGAGINAAMSEQPTNRDHRSGFFMPGSVLDMLQNEVNDWGIA